MATPSHTLRVTFGYGPEGLTIQSVTRVAMRTPAPVGDPPGVDGKGYWLAVENSAGAVVYHMPLHDPLDADREIYGEAEAAPHRRTTDHRSGAFEVLAPDIPGGGRVVLHGPTAAPTSARFLVGLANQPLASEDLQALRDRAAEGSGTGGSGTGGSGTGGQAP